MHNNVTAGAICVPMWHMFIDWWYVTLICIENHIKWSLVDHPYMVKEDTAMINHMMKINRLSKINYIS
jgi:hypothetical protein